MVHHLIEHSADPTAVERSFGLDAAGWAAHFGHAELAAYLRGLTR